MIHQLSYEELQDWQAKGRDFQLIDVRDPEERALFHIGGILIPLPEFAQRVGEIDPARPLVVYCKRGIRSQLAIQRYLQKYPTATCYNLQKGIMPIYAKVPPQVG